MVFIKSHLLSGFLCPHTGDLFRAIRFFLFLPKHFCRAFRGSREASVGSVVSQRAPERRPRLPRLVRPAASAAACGHRSGSRREHGHAGPQGAGLPPSRGPCSHGSPLVSRLLHRFFSLLFTAHFTDTAQISVFLGLCLDQIVVSDEGSQRRHGDSFSSRFPADSTLQLPGVKRCHSRMALGGR